METRSKFYLGPWTKNMYREELLPPSPESYTEITLTWATIKKYIEVWLEVIYDCPSDQEGKRSCTNHGQTGKSNTPPFSPEDTKMPPQKVIKAMKWF
jgi:hypothetical protein